MKITPELLERYQLGHCTPEEKMEVEQWLDATEYEPSQIPHDITKDMAGSVWKSLAEKMVNSPSKETLFKQLRLYAAAACIAIGFFGLGYFRASTILISDSLTATMEVTSMSDELLYLSSHPDNIKKIAADKFEVEFDGILRLYNNSRETKEIVCVGETLMVPPGQVSFFMNTKTKGLHKVNFKTGELLFYDDNIKKSPIRICV